MHTHQHSASRRTNIYFLDLPFDFGPLLRFTLTRLALIPSCPSPLLRPFFAPRSSSKALLRFFPAPALEGPAEGFFFDLDLPVDGFCSGSVILPGRFSFLTFRTAAAVERLLLSASSISKAKRLRVCLRDSPSYLPRLMLLSFLSPFLRSSLAPGKLET
jgi:hypothetical protein